MSVITAVLQNGRFAMASDSLALSDGMKDTVVKIREIKIYAGCGNYHTGYLGCSGPLCGSQILSGMIAEYVEKKYTPLDAALLKAFRETLPYCGSTPQGEYPSTGVEVLMVCRDGIWKMDRCGAIIHVLPLEHRFAYKSIFRAIGRGAECAMGAMGAMETMGMQPRSEENTAIKIALCGVDIACMWVEGCGGPVVSLWVAGSEYKDSP
jgi:hypothetical protein